jgi:predicted  nucleic acid-binding Zn-ribbon protein
MAFKDKLTSVVKTVGDKTSDAVEVTKLKSQISKEKSAIKDNYEKIGDYIYKQYRDSGYTNEDLAELFAKIDDSKVKILEYEDEIKRVKVED